MKCDACGYSIVNPSRDAVSGELNLPALIIEGERFSHLHLGCYRLLRRVMEKGITLAEARGEEPAE